MAADEAVTFYSQALATLGATDSADATPQDAPPPPIAPPAVTAEAMTAAGDSWTALPPYDLGVSLDGCRLLPENGLAVPCYQVSSKNKAEVNRTVEMYFQLGDNSPANVAKAQLLSAFMSEPFFDQLRTKEQLGYQVPSAPAS